MMNYPMDNSGNEEGMPTNGNGEELLIIGGRRQHALLGLEGCCERHFSMKWNSKKSSNRSQ
jgi:hypothetical protein